MKDDYHVSFTVIISRVVKAESHEEACEKAMADCPYDIDGTAWVTNLRTGEEMGV